MATCRLRWGGGANGLDENRERLYLSRRGLPWPAAGGPTLVDVPPPLPSFEVALAFNALTAAMTALVGLVVLAANPRRNWNQWLAFFLFLVAGNFAAQALAFLEQLARSGVSIPWGPSRADVVLARRLATVLLIFDPAVLAYFASIFPRRTLLAERPWGLALLGGPVLAFTVLEVATGHLSADTAAGEIAPVRIAFFGFLAMCYIYASWRVLANFLQEPSTVMARQASVVAFGVLVAAMSRVALLTTDVPVRELVALGVAGREALPAVELLARLILLGALYLVVRAWVAGPVASTARRAEANRMLAWIGAVFTAFTVIWVLGRAASFAAYVPVPEPFVALGMVLDQGVIFTIRWAAFSGAIVAGVVRYQALSTDIRALALAGGAMVAACTFVVGAIAVRSLGPWGAAGLSAAIGLAGFAVLLLSALRATRPRGGEDYLHRRGLEVYGAVLASALAEGAPRVGLAEKHSGLRERLHLTLHEHERLLALAEAEESRGAHERILGRYVLLRRLGAGGFATVHLARDTQSGELVAVKRLEVPRGGHRGAWDGALRELAVARRVSHPNLIAVHDVVSDGEGAVIVMEYAAEGSLRDLLDREGRPSAREASRLVEEMLAGLEAVHDAGVVHGDLKPENVLLGPGREVKLADFGAARGAPAHQTLVHRTAGPAAFGSLPYLAPEVARGGAATPASDVYALGAIAHELVTGRPLVPIEGRSAFDVLREVSDARHVFREWPERWAGLLQRALDPDRSRRYPDARAMRAAWFDLAGSEAGAATKKLPSSPREETIP